MSADISVKRFPPRFNSTRLTSSSTDDGKLLRLLLDKFKLWRCVNLQNKLERLNKMNSYVCYSYYPYYLLLSILLFITSLLVSQGHSNISNCYVVCMIVKVCTLDIVPLRESSLQKHSGMARVLKGSHSFSCTPTRSSASGMSHTCLCLPSNSWYSFTDPRGMEGWVGLGGRFPSETVYLPEGCHSFHY